MQTISNGAVSITAEDNGRGLTLKDLKRGTIWLLDEASAKWCGSDTHNHDADDYPAHFQPLAPVRAQAEGDCLAVSVLAGDYPLTFRYTLLSDGLEVRLPPVSGGQVKAVSMPGAFLPAGEPMKLLLPIMQGMLWDGRGENIRRVCRSGAHYGFSMMMFGVLAESGGLLVTAETAVDSLWWYQKDDRGIRAQNMQDNSLGALRYERVIRLYFTNPRIVPLAKRYRARVKERGRFATWEEKIAKRPGLQKLFGSLMCYIGYCQDDLNYARELEKIKAYGFDRALVYPVDFNCYDRGFQMGGLPPIRLPQEEIDRILALGYDVCPWTWINEAIDDQTPERAAMYRITRDNSRVFGWQIDENKWYKVCSPEMYRREREAVSGSFSRMTWDHFDVLTCASIGECYATDHWGHPGQPLSRDQDLQWLRRTLVAGQGEDSRGSIVSSENFNDLFSLEYDIGSVKAWPQYGPWVFWPVPLTSLVYHDSILHSWWEMHSYNAGYFNRRADPNLFEYGGGRPALQAAADALMGCPPDVFPFGAQYAWTGRGAQTRVFRFRFEDPQVQHALALALPVAGLHRRIGKLEMTDFEILSEDGWVQRSAFADGTEVTANFGYVLRNDVEGIEPIGGHQWRVK